MDGNQSVTLTLGNLQNILHFKDNYPIISIGETHKSISLNVQPNDPLRALLKHLQLVSGDFIFSTDHFQDCIVSSRKDRSEDTCG